MDSFYYTIKFERDQLHFPRNCKDCGLIQRLPTSIVMVLCYRQIIMDDQSLVSFKPEQDFEMKSPKFGYVEYTMISATIPYTLYTVHNPRCTSRIQLRQDNNYYIIPVAIKVEGAILALQNVQNHIRQCI